MCNFSVLKQSSVSKCGSHLLLWSTHWDEAERNPKNRGCVSCSTRPVRLPSGVHAALQLVLLNSFEVVTFEDHSSIKRCFLACSTVDAVTWDGWSSLCSAGHFDLPPLPLEERRPFIVQAEMIAVGWDQCSGGSAAENICIQFPCRSLCSLLLFHRAKWGAVGLNL